MLEQSMAIEIQDPSLTIGVGTSVIFDMSEADALFKRIAAEKGRVAGEAAYRDYMRERKDEPLAAGPGMEFIKAHLEGKDNGLVIASRNSASTALRAMRSLYNEGIIAPRLYFTNGGDIAPYMQAYNIDLFLSTNGSDVQKILQSGTPAALIKHRKGLVKARDIERVLEMPLPIPSADVSSGTDMRYAFNAGTGLTQYIFDFDKVLAGSEAEDYYIQNGLEAYLKYEDEHRDLALEEGPMLALFRKLTQLNMVRKFSEQSIVTARGGLAAFRILNTLVHWDIEPNGELHMRRDLSKGPVLKVMRDRAPDRSIFFDDGDKNILAAEGANVLAGKIPDFSL